MEIPWQTPGLAEMDDALRCHVCKDFYNGPLITTCGHTFCSLCIRRHLDSNPRCPICWKETTISQLRANIAVTDATESWTRIRQHLSNLESCQLPEPITESESMAEDHDLPSRKRKAPPEHTGICPICSAVLPIEELQTTHIDSCLKRQQRVQEPLLVRKKMTMPNYALLSDAKLKKLLVDSGLSSKGNKQRLQARYREYVHQYNANMESQHPKSKRELLQEMRAWDMAQDRQSTNNIKDIDAQKWQNQYHQDFDELIAQAKQSRISSDRA